MKTLEGRGPSVRRQPAGSSTPSKASATRPAAPLRVVKAPPPPVPAASRASVVVLVSAVGMLVVLGLVMVLSAGSVASLQNFGWSYYYFSWQVPAVLAGTVIGWLVSRIDYRRLRALCAPGLLVVLGLLALVLVPEVGHSAYGSTRWLGRGAFKFQPSEPAKLALALYCAHATATRAKAASVGALIGPALAAMAATGMLVVMEPDLGTTVVLCAIAFAVIVAAGASRKSVGTLVVGGVLAGLTLALTASYRRARIFSFLDPWGDPTSSGYQLVQSLIALGGGGWTGVGLGASRQKWSFLPNAHTDFIFAIIGEELGLVGTLTVVVLFGAVAWAGLRIAARAPDLFGALAATGITAWLVVQGIENMGTVTGLLPVTGIPLPFVSYGMSQLVTSLTAVGVLVSIGRAGKR